MRECIKKCVPGLIGDDEFGRLDYGPMTLQEIRKRQEVTEPLAYSIRAGNLRYASLTQRGYYPEDLEKDSQDALTVITDLGGKEGTLLAGVFDGHGEYGDDCAGFVRDNINYYY